MNNKTKRTFASDNNSGVHPEIIEAISSVNQGHVLAYGDDPYTVRTKNLFKNLFGSETETFFTFLGTGANVLGLSFLLQPYQSVLCAASAHINEDECGAVERFTGSKLVPIPTKDGKLNPDMLQDYLHGMGFEHHAQPKVISISQPTELGTVYQIDEIQALSHFAHQNQMFLHMDGARIANAAVSLGVDFKAFTADSGVDVLSFGGTKNGLMYGEAILFFNSSLNRNDSLKYIRKQGMQLASKMRYISIQFETYLVKEIWRQNALNANKMAFLLAEKLSSFDSFKIQYLVEANGVFVQMPKTIAEKLQEHTFFYSWNETESIYRLMCSWDTQAEDIEQFIQLIKGITHSYNVK